MEVVRGYPLQDRQRYWKGPFKSTLLGVYRASAFARTDPLRDYGNHEFILTDGSTSRSCKLRFLFLFLDHV